MNTAHKFIPFGTSRLHRPFAKRVNASLITNIHDSIEAIFPRVGYFHTAQEALQAIRFLKDPESIPRNLWEFVFRIEPRQTTPLNEFDLQLESAIRNNTEFTPTIEISMATHVIIEVSSLTANLHTSSGIFLHANPNAKVNIAYPQIYPDGFYSKFMPQLPVQRIETDVQALKNTLESISCELPDTKIITLGHLTSDSHPNKIRSKINATLKEASASSHCTYIDTAPFVEKYGFAEVNGQTDIHHLSADGEAAIGNMLQEIILCN